MSTDRSTIGTLCLFIVLALSECGIEQSLGPTIAPKSTSTPTVTATTVSKVTIVYDDDGSPDGTTALLYLLSQSQADMRAINITFGEAHPKIYIQHIGRILDSFGISGISLGYGQDAPLAGTNQFPEKIRQTANRFWGLPIPNAGKSYPAQPAPEVIASVITQSPQPVTVFVSGPSTNLAQALRINPDIKKNIAAVYIMGGAVYVPGNISGLIRLTDNQVAEWNIFADPQAASEVFESGLTIYLVPLDATNQVQITRQDTAQWLKGGENAKLAVAIYDRLFFDSGMDNAPIWDLMTAAIMLKPDLCEFQSLHLEVVTGTGVDSGQTRIISGEKPNIFVCLKPDVNSILQTVDDAFSSSNLE